MTLKGTTRVHVLPTRFDQIFCFLGVAEDVVHLASAFCGPSFMLEWFASCRRLRQPSLFWHRMLWVASSHLAD